ncbi:hypothetical protein JCM10213_006800 [Rhodosporidiobolus nylandii]
MSLLPAELWDHCLSLLPPSHLQHTALALSRALPQGENHISRALLWRHLLIRREGQAYQCTRRLREEEQGTAQAVRTVKVEVWRDDAQLLVNLLLALPALRSIELTAGPLAAPEDYEDLFDPAGLQRTRRFDKLEQLAVRFNPYVSERSYYTFLKGAYFDSLLLSLSRLPPSLAPSLRRLSIAQDLPPTHGTTPKSTLAFGLHDLGAELDSLQLSQIQVPTSGRFGRKWEKADPMGFAQPIVFFQLSCLTTLSLSPLGAQLTSLTFRIPRRALLPSLTDVPSPVSHPPFPSLKHLDISTSHVIDDARLAMFLRMCPTLESLVLDRCSGLISKDAVEEPTAVATLRWLGKVMGGVGLSRSEDALRTWRRLAKERPSDAPNLSRPSRRSTPSATRPATPSSTSTTDELVPPVRELLVIPPPSALTHLGLGLHDLPPRVAAAWERSFMQGYEDATRRTVEKLEEALERWDRWGRTGQLGDGTRRLCTFVDALPPQLQGEEHAEGQETEEEDPDPTFARFCRLRQLRPISPAQAKEILSVILAQPGNFNLCTTPACSNSPGTPHLSVSASGSTAEDPAGRRERERTAWEREALEETERKARGGHKEDCAHGRGENEWALGRFS